MGATSRKHYGKLWKQGLVKGKFEKYYKEFKDEIDAELEPSKEIPKAKPKKSSEET